MHIVRVARLAVCILCVLRHDWLYAYCACCVTIGCMHIVRVASRLTECILCVLRVCISGRKGALLGWAGGPFPPLQTNCVHVVNGTQHVRHTTCFSFTNPLQTNCVHVVKAYNM
jgi:hypothetical protein